MSVSMHDFIVDERAQILAYCAAKVTPLSPGATVDTVLAQLGSFLNDDGLVAGNQRDRERLS